MNRLDSYTPLGLLPVWGRDRGRRRRDRASPSASVVACAGNEYALHAEVNWVPVNLCVAVPDERRSPARGLHHGRRHRHAGRAPGRAWRSARSACVIGLGLVGQLLVQLLRADGVRVVGIDIVGGAVPAGRGAGRRAAPRSRGRGPRAGRRRPGRATGGLGADAVFLSAGGDTNGPVELAARLARDRGRVVDIGKCSLDLPWNAYYEKELDVRFSRSYGPGRYDPIYEERGRRLPGRLRALDRAAQPGVLPRPARAGPDRARPADLRRHTVRRPRRRSTSSSTRASSGASASSSSTRPRSAMTRTVVRPRPVPSAAGTTSTPSTPATPRGADRLHRRGQLRLDHAPAAPRRTARTSRSAHVATASSLSCSRRAAQVRLRDRRRRTAEDAARRRVDIDAVFVVTRHHSHADHRLRGPAGRQGRLRGEAARHSRRSSSRR